MKYRSSCPPIAFLFIALGIALPGAALADSDGYFCAAEGLLVFDEMRETKPFHVLHAVRLEPGPEGFSRTQHATPGFQIHLMKCDAESVSIYGGGRGKMQWYHYSVSDQGGLTLDRTEEPAEPITITMSTPNMPENLGHYGKIMHRYWEYPTLESPLPSADSAHSYAITTKATPGEPGPGLCNPLRVVSTLEHRSSAGELMRSEVLYDQTRSTECADSM